MLPMITLEDLKTDLEVVEVDHRLKIMMAIGYLFPSIRKPMEVEQWESPLLQSSEMVSCPWVSRMDISPCTDAKQIEE